MSDLRASMPSAAAVAITSAVKRVGEGRALLMMNGAAVEISHHPEGRPRPRFEAKTQSLRS